MRGTSQGPPLSGSMAPWTRGTWFRGGEAVLDHPVGSGFGGRIDPIAALGAGV